MPVCDWWEQDVYSAAMKLLVKVLHGVARSKYRKLLKATERYRNQLKAKWYTSKVIEV